MSFLAIKFSVEVRRRRGRPRALKKATYEEFKALIQRELKENPAGLTWTELRRNLNLSQVVPNNKWVRNMERDIGLLRVREPKGTVWRLG